MSQTDGQNYDSYTVLACVAQLFSRINTNSLHILHQYLVLVSLRPRRHNITLITKTSELDHRDFIIRNIYKDLY